MKAEKAIDGKAYQRDFRWIDGTSQVVITHVTTCADGKAYMSFTLDMSNLSEKEILEHAARDINIQWIRPKLFRPFTVDEVINMNGRTIKADEYRPTKKSKLSPVEQADRLLAKLTPEERAMVLKKHGK